MLRRWINYKKGLVTSVSLSLGEPTWARQQSCKKSAMPSTGRPMIFDPTGKKVKYMVQVHARYLYLCSWSQIESSTLGPSLKVNGSLLACTSITLNWINILNAIVQRAWYPECNDIWDQPWLYIPQFPRFWSCDDQELNLVQEFIAQCSKAKNVNEQPHSIWCVSTCPWKNKYFNI